MTFDPLALRSVFRVARRVVGAVSFMLGAFVAERLDRESDCKWEKKRTIKSVLLFREDFSRFVVALPYAG